MIFRLFLYASMTMATMLIVSVAYRREPFTGLGIPGAAALILANYVISNIIWLAFGVPVGMQLFPSIDAICFVLAFMQWYAGRQQWAFLLAGSFGLEVCRHIAYLAGAVSDYVLFLNICYIAQLLCVALPSLLKLMGEPQSGRAAS